VTLEVQNDERFIVVSIAALWMLSLCVMLVAIPIVVVVVWLSVIILVVGIGVSLLMLAVAFIIVALTGLALRLLGMSRHDCDLSKALLHDAKIS